MKCSESRWVELPEPVGSEPVFWRPILVMHSDDFNHSRNRAIPGTAITSNLRAGRGAQKYLAPKTRNEPVQAVRLQGVVDCHRG